VNSDGKIIGSIRRDCRRPGFMFAVSSNPRTYVAGHLIMHGKVKRAHLGVRPSGEPHTAHIGISKNKKVYTFEINADVNALNTQLKLGDIIVNLRKTSTTVDNLHKYLNETVIGKKQTQHLREEESKIITVVPG